MTEKEIEEFWGFVAIGDDCWEWKGGKAGKGYGSFHKKPSHILSYKMMVGEVPKGLCVLHHCDNRPCVRPDHLFIGTKGDNNRDCARKGRTGGYKRTGINNGQAKLTDEKVIEMRKLHAAGETLISLGVRFGVSGSRVWDACNGVTWRHIGEPQDITLTPD